MDASRFDQMVRIASGVTTRRGLLALLIALPIVGAPDSPLGSTGAVAGRLHRRHTRHRRKHDNRKGQRKGKRKGDGGAGPGARCLALGASCDRLRPSGCCTGSCRPPGSAGLAPNAIPSLPGEPHECVEAAFGCKPDQNTCPPTGDSEIFACPDLEGGRCFVSVEGRSFCGGHGSECVACDSDEDCVDLHGPGHHCVECEDRCNHPGSTSFRACFAEGPAAA